MKRSIIAIVFCIGVGVGVGLTELLTTRYQLVNIPNEKMYAVLDTKTSRLWLRTFDNTSKDNKGIFSFDIGTNEKPSLHFYLSTPYETPK